MSKIKYAVFPQYVISASDSDRHYISAEKLMNLFGVNPKECEIWKEEDMLKGFRPRKELVWLTPMYNGDYSLETAIKRMGFKNEK